MRADEAPADLLDLLVLRYDLLASLREAPAEKPRLVERVDSSRATVYRAVNELEAEGLIHRAEDGYELTQAGGLLLEGFAEFAGLAGDVDDAQDLLAVLPPDPRVGTAFVRGAEVIEAGDPDTRAPAARLESLIGGATRVRGLAVAQSQESAAAVYHRRVVEEGELSVEMVFDAAFYEYLQGSDDPRIEALLASDDVVAYKGGSLPFGLFLVDRPDGERACLAVYEEGFLHGVLVNGADGALAWAESVFRRYRDAADPA